MTDRLSRREFLELAAGLAAAGLVDLGDAAHAAALAEKLAAADSPVMQYRLLGRTGLKVSEIGFGAYPINDPEVIHHAIDRGINYIDTSDDYRRGRSEEVIGQAIRTKRDKVVIATKFHPWARTTRKEITAALDGSLRRLQTDYVDIVAVHDVGQASGGEGVERIQNPELFAAFEEARRKGKVRFLGVTGHGGDLMAIMGHAIDDGRFDMILNRYNLLDYPEQQALFKRARARGVGVAVMKTLAGAKGQNTRSFRKHLRTFRQAALKWVLTNPDIATAVISISTNRQVDEYVAASGASLTGEDRQVLELYARLFGDSFCRLCNACEPACPYGLPVADTLRHLMYAADYGQPERGQAFYASLQRNASRCAGCTAPCQAACGYGVAIKREMGKAHLALS